MEFINLGSSRFSQYYKVRWSAIERQAGTYDSAALDELDQIITFHRENGVSVYFGLYGTPAFYAGTTPNPVYSDAVTRGPWGDLGECSHPTSLLAVSNFCTMLVTRYNLPGGEWFDLHGDTFGKGIQYWETWNEPGSAESPSNGNMDGQSSVGFYWGSRFQLVDLCRAQYLAIKAADPSIVVTSPGFSGIGSAGPFLQSGGNDFPDTSGREVVDAVAIHPYGACPPGESYMNWDQDAVSGVNGIHYLKASISAIGDPSIPVYISEWGLSGDRDSTIDAWNAEPAEFRYKWIARLFATWAAYGVKCVHPWNWLTTDGQGISGEWRTDVYGVQKAYNDFAEKVSGKTITYFEIGEPMTIKFSDGTEWII